MSWNNKEEIINLRFISLFSRLQDNATYQVTLLHNFKFSHTAPFNTVCNYNMTIQFLDNELGKILIVHSSK